VSGKVWTVRKRLVTRARGWTVFPRPRGGVRRRGRAGTRGRPFPVSFTFYAFRAGVGRPDAAPAPGAIRAASGAGIDLEPS